jgi:hypothetical protein
MDYNNTEIETTPKNNTALYSVGVLLLISMIFTIYTYLSYDMVQKGDLKEKYVKKDNIEFDILPSYVQDEYIKKYIHTTQVDSLNSQIRDLKNNGNKNIPCEPKIIEKIVEVEKVVEIEKIINQSSSISKDENENKTYNTINKSKYDSFKCYDMDSGGIYPSVNSVKKLNKFLDKNNDARLFEVIGVINKAEFLVLDKLKNEANKKSIERISNLSQIGLSRKRVIEGTWSIKNHLGVDTNIQVVNYTITSKKNNKGFVVRAYK